MKDGPSPLLTFKAFCEEIAAAVPANNTGNVDDLRTTPKVSKQAQVKLVRRGRRRGLRSIP